MKENLARNLCDMLVKDIKLAVQWLDNSPTSLADKEVRKSVVIVAHSLGRANSLMRYRERYLVFLFFCYCHIES